MTRAVRPAPDATGRAGPRLAAAALAVWLGAGAPALAQEPRPAADYDDRIIDACLSEHWGGLNARESCIAIAARACMPVGEGDAAVAVACFDAERAQWDARMTDALDALRARLAERDEGGAGGAAAGGAAEDAGTDAAAEENAAMDAAGTDTAAAEDPAADADAATAPAAADNAADAEAPATAPAAADADALATAPTLATEETHALAALDTMQSAWETWRDAACAYDAALYPGTSVADTVRADCLMRLTARQAFHLTARLERGD